MEKLIEVAGYPGYMVSKQGSVYSTKSGQIKQIAQTIGSNGRYLYVHLSNNGIKKNVAVHRIVAAAFVANPNNCDEVNHLDHNTFNNNADNLEWCSHRDNILHSYEILPPDRNHCNADLYHGNQLIGSFKSIASAAHYAKIKYGCNETSLQKYHKSGEYWILSFGSSNRNSTANYQPNTTQNKRPIQLFYKDSFVCQAKTIKEFSAVIKKYNLFFTPSSIAHRIARGQFVLVQDYTFQR